MSSRNVEILDQKNKFSQPKQTKKHMYDWMIHNTCNSLRLFHLSLECSMHRQAEQEINK